MEPIYKSGSLAVIGIGPGHVEEMTPRALKAIQDADCIVGYHTYLALIAPLIEGKETVGTGMMQEVDRCQQAIEKACTGKKTAVISSGDPGVYGMAGLILELVQKLPEDKRPPVEIIAGLSAVNAAAAILGAPLMHDFAVISLSDLMTPWEVIKKRAACAADGDFVIALYNPKSHKRVTHLQEIQQIVLQYRPASTPVGIVRKAGRDNQSMTLSTLSKLHEEDVDMQSLVIIGNSRTYIAGDRMITPRGYNL